MEALFEIVPRVLEIREQVTQDDIHQLHHQNDKLTSSPATATAAAVFIPTSIDPEVQRLEKLRKEAIETAQYAELMKAEADELKQYTVSRPEDKIIIKNAKQATKAASKAYAAALEAGAIANESDIKNRGYDMSLLAMEDSNINVALHK